MIRGPLLAAVLASTLTGCLHDEAGQAVDAPPLQLRGTTPADSVQYVHEADGLDIVARFNRDLGPEDVTEMWFTPPPLASKGPFFDVGGEIYWRDVVLDPAARKVTLFLYGPAFLRPETVVFFPGDDGWIDPDDPVVPDPGGTDQDPTGDYLAGLPTIARPRSSAEGAVLFVLDVDPGPLPLPAGQPTMLGLPIADVVRLDAPLADGRHPFAIGHLARAHRYVTIAVLDADGDGRHVPGADWTGYRFDELENDRPLWYRSASEVTTQGVSFHSFQILPPGVLRPRRLP